MYDILKRLNELHVSNLRDLDADGLRRFEALCEHWAKLSESELARRKSLPSGNDAHPAETLRATGTE